MLVSLTLRNLATISDTSVEFRDGLNILTGETGAGKSILIDGLLLALGTRADRAKVRTGAQTASVEAFFTGADGTECIVRREVRSQGRSRFFVNDELSTLEDGREVISGMVDLHSQESTPALLGRRTQMKALDEYGGCSGLAEEVSEVFGKYTSAMGRMEELEARVSGMSEKRDLARHELLLIEKLDPSQEDYESLTDERRQLKSAGDGARILGELDSGISGDDGMLDLIASWQSSLRNSPIDVTELLELLEQAEIALSEAGSQCERALSRIESAPWRMEEIDRRLDGYSDLLGRCGGSLETLLRLRGKLAAELEGYDRLEEELADLREDLPLMENRLLEMSRRLSAARMKAAENLVESVERELRMLAMPHAVFGVEMTGPGEHRSRNIQGIRICSDGAEIPEFRFSANPGMQPGPLSAVASGGEMSRVSLVLKLALSSVTQAPTMIFDEIDSGVGGETANLLAESLSRVSRQRQVIIITHLPQIASRADHHLAVSKGMESGLPVTRVQSLESRDQRVEELSRLLGGGSGAREHAEKMIPVPVGGTST